MHINTSLKCKGNDISSAICDPGEIKRPYLNSAFLDANVEMNWLMDTPC